MKVFWHHAEGQLPTLEAYMDECGDLFEEHPLVLPPLRGNAFRKRARKKRHGACSTDARRLDFFFDVMVEPEVPLPLLHCPLGQLLLHHRLLLGRFLPELKPAPVSFCLFALLDFGASSHDRVP